MLSTRHFAEGFFFFLIISWFTLPEDFLPEVFCHVLILNVSGGEAKVSSCLFLQDKVISLSYLDAQAIFFIWSPLASCWLLLSSFSPWYPRLHFQSALNLFFLIFSCITYLLYMHMYVYIYIYLSYLFFLFSAAFIQI